MRDGSRGFTFYNAAKVLLYMRELEQKTPVFADVHPSNVCNHRCVWCRYMRNRDLLSLEALMDFINRYPSLRGITVGGGGEPLANRHILAFIVECRNRNIKTGVFTNGSLLDEESIEVIGSSCQFCRVSLDAATEDTHARLHRSRDFDKILMNIRRLRETPLPELGISYLVTADNMSDIPLLADLELPVDYVHFKPLVQGIDKQTRNRTLTLLPELSKRVSYAVKFDRIREDLMHNKAIPCRIADLVTLLAADNKEYVCCEHSGEDRFERGKWDGSTALCHTCRYNPYNEIIYIHERNMLAAEFL